MGVEFGVGVDSGGAASNEQSDIFLSGVVEPPDAPALEVDADRSQHVTGDITELDPISQFSLATTLQDPISQFPTASFQGRDAGDCLDDVFAGPANSDVDGWTQVGSEVGDSLDRLKLRRFLESDAGYSPSFGGAESLHNAFQTGKIPDDTNPNLDHVGALQSFDRSLPSQGPKFMWEQDGFLGAVFSQKSSVFDPLFSTVQLKRPAPAFVDLTGNDSSDAPVVKALRKGAVKHVFMDFFSRSTVENDESKRHSFLCGWATLVLIRRDAFSAFDGAFEDVGDAPERPIVVQCLAECLAAKATSTIGKRLGSMARYARYCESNKLQVFPLTERSLYLYMHSLHSDVGSSASVGRSFLEAVRFSAAMLGLSGLQKDQVPQRVSGLAELLARRAPSIKQAAPLTVRQVAKLEETCCCSDSIQDRATVGGLLMMLYSCARASDAARAMRLIVDRVSSDGLTGAEFDAAGFVECGVLGHKGARSQTHKRTLLPLVSPMMGVTQHKWWDSWLQAREALVLEVTGKLKFPLLCRFTDQGLPVEHPLQASEMGRFLRNILGVEHNKTNLVRSHSLKVTVLSWMAKAGCSLSVRRSLGHHLDVGSKSATIYARDAMSPPLREMCRVLGMIAREDFLPDSTRSGRFRKELKPAAAEKEGDESGEDSEASYELPFSERLVGDTDDSNTDASSDAGDDQSDAEVLDATTLWDLVEPRHRPNLVKVKPGFDTRMHVQSRVSHLLAKDSSRFVCGRLTSDRYAAVAQGASNECIRCQTCFTNKHVVEEARLPELDK
eukprot:s19_g49.t1